MDNAIKFWDILDDMPRIIFNIPDTDTVIYRHVNIKCMMVKYNYTTRERTTKYMGCDIVDIFITNNNIVVHISSNIVPSLQSLILLNFNLDILCKLPAADIVNILHINSTLYVMHKDTTDEITLIENNINLTKVVTPNPCNTVSKLISFITGYKSFEEDNILIGSDNRYLYYMSYYNNKIIIVDIDVDNTDSLFELLPKDNAISVNLNYKLPHSLKFSD